uniref:Enoyl reductase (ER) domain-containing protein n=1 Tax=Timema tahoe TaxID=61484 RepID=A0A7R9IKD0_9NEOP|nr:unnamed protein product [Timema tahoe]
MLEVLPIMAFCGLPLIKIFYLSYWQAGWTDTSVPAWEISRYNKARNSLTGKAREKGRFRFSSSAIRSTLFKVYSRLCAVCSHTYAEYIIVPDLQFLVKLPDSIPLSVAAMLPTGALLAMNTVSSVHQHVSNILKVKDTCKILIVGTGGLALWALRIAGHHFINIKNRISITVASLKDEGFTLAKECEKVNVVQWNEDVYEKQLIERTIDACKGKVNIVIDFGTTSRSLHRSLQCLSKGGVVFISSEVAEKLLPKFSRRAEERQQTMKPVDMGSIEQLRQLVDIVGKGEIEPPPHTVFPAEEASEVVKKLCHSEIQGRAILRFHSIE